MIFSLLLFFCLGGPLSAGDAADLLKDEGLDIRDIASFSDLMGDLISYTIGEPGREVLVLCDIDNTLICSVGYEGSYEQAIDHLKAYRSQGMLPQEAFGTAVEEFNALQPSTQTQLTHPYVSTFIDYLNSAGAYFLPITARRPEISLLTLEQLKANGITWLGLDNDSTPLSFSPSCSYEDRILFCGEQNAKGKVFTQFYNQKKAFFDSKISCILFIDDTADHLRSVGRACKELGLEFHGYHFQFGRNFDLLPAN